MCIVASTISGNEASGGGGGFDAIGLGEGLLISNSTIADNYAATGGGLYLFGPTGGYLWGFLLAAGIVGTASRRFPRFPAVFAAMALGEAAILLLGALQLAAVAGGGWRWVFAAGVAPFLPGDIVKLALAASIFRLLAPRRGNPSDFGSHRRKAP